LSLLLFSILTSTLLISTTYAAPCNGVTCIYANTVKANVVYQNANGISLEVYGTVSDTSLLTGTQLSVWVGNLPTFTTANFVEVYNSVASANGLNSQISGMFFIVPPKWYFSVNDFGSAANTFIFEYINMTAPTFYGNIIAGNVETAGNVVAGNLYGNVLGQNTVSALSVNATTINGNSLSTILVVPPTVQAPQYSAVAILLYLGGMVLFLLTILMVFSIVRPWKLYGTLLGGLIGLLIALLSVILIASGLAYTASYSAAAHTITAPNTLITVGQQIIGTQPMANNIIFADFGDLMMIVDIVIGLAYLMLSLVVFRKEREKKKYGVT